jgi:hypothetical protein
MKRCLSAVVVLAALALPARAHFLWIVPDPTAPGKPAAAKVIFSDSLEPDTNVPVTKVAATKLWIRDADGKTTEGKWAEGKHAYTITLPDGQPRLIGGVCHYGVFQRGKEEPMLLNYYAKTVAGDLFRDSGPGAVLDTLFNDWKQFPLDCVPARGALRFVWHGKPLADTEVTMIDPKGEAIKHKTDDEGLLKAAPKGPGLWGVRVGVTEKKAGTLDGKEYKAVRSYLTLVVRVPKGQGIGSGTGQLIGRGPPTKEDPAASKLLADARAARANWRDFPGFTAELTVNLDGKTHPGKLTVTGKGKVKVDVADEEAREWARRELASLVAHRLDNSSALETPCAFLDDNAAHPLGRAIRVLNDELHSSYRVRDRQIIEVNRHMKDSRFTITVVENRLNAEKQFLPVSYVVNYWDLKSQNLLRSQTHHDTWTRVGSFDLPETVLVVTATGNGSGDAAGKLQARSLKLSGHKLLK